MSINCIDKYDGIRQAPCSTRQSEIISSSLKYYLNIPSLQQLIQMHSDKKEQAEHEQEQTPLKLWIKDQMKLYDQRQLKFSQMSVQDLHYLIMGLEQHPEKAFLIPHFVKIRKQRLKEEAIKRSKVKAAKKEENSTPAERSSNYWGAINAYLTSWFSPSQPSQLPSSSLKQSGRWESKILSQELRQQSEQASLLPQAAFGSDQAARNPPQIRKNTVNSKYE